jgi:hypothetical protein
MIQTHVPDSEFRADFVRDLINFFMECDMDGTELRHVHPEIDKALDDLEEVRG